MSLIHFLRSCIRYSIILGIYRITNYPFFSDAVDAQRIVQERNVAKIGIHIVVTEFFGDQFSFGRNHGK